MTAFHTIAVPHEDILAGRLTLDIFAADLWEVHKGRAPDEYRDPTRQPAGCGREAAQWPPQLDDTDYLTTWEVMKNVGIVWNLAHLGAEQHPTPADGGT